jgi:hypothetical protein
VADAVEDTPVRAVADNLEAEYKTEVWDSPNLPLDRTG